MLQLIPTILREKPRIAISHGSRAQLVASKLLRVPSILIFDYEFAQGLMRSTWMLCPEVIGRGAHRNNLLTYPGIKEDVYVPRFTPDPGLSAELGLDPGDLVVTVRPPATEAHYHNPESELLLDAVFEMLAEIPDTRIILLPRNERQETAIRRAWPELFANGKIRVPPHVVDGLNLIWHSDMVISGGGTMNREAAALGVPVYSIFRGHIGAVDRYLASQGRLVIIESVEDVQQKIPVHRRDPKGAPQNVGTGTLIAIVENIIRALDSLTATR